MSFANDINRLYKEAQKKPGSQEAHRKLVIEMGERIVKRTPNRKPTFLDRMKDGFSYVLSKFFPSKLKYIRRYYDRANWIFSTKESSCLPDDRRIKN